MDNNFNNNPNDRKKKAINVVVYKREGTVFEGIAETISSFNEIGAFDILPEHARMVSVIQEKLVLNVGLGINKEIIFGRGILRIIDGQAEVYIGV